MIEKIRVLGLMALWPLLFTVGTSTDLVNANYEPNEPDLKDVYADNIITVPTIHSFKNLNCHQIAQNANNKVIATISGEEAKNVLNALEDGKCLTFKVVEIPDTEDKDLVIEIVEMNEKQIITSV